MDLIYKDLSTAKLKEIIYACGVLFEKVPKVFLISGKCWISSKYGKRKELELQENNPVLILDVKTIYLTGLVNGKILRIEPINNTGCTYKVQVEE